MAKITQSGSQIQIKIRDESNDDNEEFYFPLDW